MNRISVASSNIVSIGYDKTRKLLEIEFKGGSIYQYSDVPLGVYEELMAAGSRGKYFAAHIKNGEYSCIRIS